MHVIEATALERHLELTLELLQLGRPLVAALNRMDEARARGGPRRFARARTSARCAGRAGNRVDGLRHCRALRNSSRCRAAQRIARPAHAWQARRRALGRFRTGADFAFPCTS
ncbi:MAG: FeoB small GTPase domain-containing protein [Burkholderiales bacterium]